ncbi:hypothetical protein ES705_33241 [subsurface metagenome]
MSRKMEETREITKRELREIEVGVRKKIRLSRESIKAEIKAGFPSRTEEIEARCRVQALGARAELSTYLQTMSWDYFLTVTTRRPWQDSIALNREVYTNLNCATAVERAFICTEPHYIRSGVHAHGIVKVDIKYRAFIPTSLIWSNLFQRFGRSSVDLVRSQGDVSMYCSKYVTKSSGDYNFWGRNVFWQGE